MTEGDAHQCGQAGPDAFGSQRRGRCARVLVRDAHPQYSGPDAKLQRRIEDERLPVDACRQRPLGIDLEGHSGPLAPRTLKKAASLTTIGGRPYDGDAEQAVVDVRTRA